MSTTSTQSAGNADVLAANKAVVKAFFEAWDKPDYDRMDSLMDPDGEWWTLVSRRSIPIRDQMLRIRGISDEPGSGVRFDIGEMTAEEDRVSVLIEGSATFEGRGEYNNAYHFLLKVRDGKIYWVRTYYDTALANRILRGEGSALGPMKSHALERND